VQLLTNTIPFFVDKEKKRRKKEKKEKKKGNPTYPPILGCLCTPCMSPGLVVPGRVKSIF